MRFSWADIESIKSQEANIWLSILWLYWIRQIVFINFNIGFDYTVTWKSSVYVWTFARSRKLFNFDICHIEFHHLELILIANLYSIIWKTRKLDNWKMFKVDCPVIFNGITYKFSATDLVFNHLLILIFILNFFLKIKREREREKGSNNILN